MPAFGAHYFFMIDVLMKMDEELQERIKKYLAYFEMGAQGPEIYYYYKPYNVNNINSYGTELHQTKFKKIVEDSVKRIKEYDDEGALIYLLGVATHYALDSSLHRIINKKVRGKNEHMLIEADFDHYVISNHVKKYKPHKVRRNFLIRYPGNKKKAYGSQISLVFPNVDNSRTNEVIYQFDLYLGHLYSPRMVKGKIIKFLSKKFVKTGVDYSNMIIKEEPSHKYDDVMEQLQEKYDEQIDYAISYIQNIIDYYENGKKLSNSLNHSFI